MRQPTSHDHEWFQATVVLGNFDSHAEALAAAKEFEKRDDFVTLEVKGSWH